MIEAPAAKTHAKQQSAKGVLFAMSSPDGISRSALSKAARLAGALGTDLELFYCGSEPDLLHPSLLSPRSAEQNVREFVERRWQQLSSLAEDLRQPGLNVSSRVEWDNRPEEGVVREVLRRKPALLVVESFHKSHSGGLLFEQAMHKLVETCPCPLLLIRTARPYPTHPRLVAAVDPMHARAKPAALDRVIVKSASEVSDALAGELHLFHVRTPWATASHQARVFRWVPDVAKDDDQVAYEHVVLARLNDLARRHKIASLRMHVVDGEVSECLPSFLRAESVDIVVMGALSRSLLKRLLIGDTTQRLLDELDCDVLVVKPPGFRSSVTLPES